MYRQTRRHCPRCSRELQPVPLPGSDGSTMVDLCSSCKGVFFDFTDGAPCTLAQELVDQGLFSLETPDEASCAHCGGELTAHPDFLWGYRCKRCYVDSVGPQPGGSLLCPACGEVLTERPDLAGLYGCGSCKSLFVRGRRTLERLAAAERPIGKGPTSLLDRIIGLFTGS